MQPMMNPMMNHGPMMGGMNHPMTMMGHMPMPMMMPMMGMNPMMMMSRLVTHSFPLFGFGNWKREGLGRLPGAGRACTIRRNHFREQSRA